MRTPLCLLVGPVLALKRASSVVCGVDVQLSTLWSLRPPQQTVPPEVEDSHWPRSVIDQFVLAEMEHHGLAPTRDASRAALVRRVYFDLIGLPPTPHERIVHLYQLAVSRPPTPAELKLAMAFITDAQLKLAADPTIATGPQVARPWKVRAR